MSNIVVLLFIVFLIYRTLFASFGFKSFLKGKPEEDLLDAFLRKNGEKTKKKTKTNKKPPIQIINTSQDIDQEKELDALFLKNVEKVVETVVTAFADGNKTILKNLLNDKTYASFENEINSNIENKRFLKSIIVSFEDKKIISKILSEDTVNISVELVMKQINYIENENNEVVFGDKNKVTLVKEIWNFTTNTRVTPNIWLISSIQALE